MAAVLAGGTKSTVGIRTRRWLRSGRKWERWTLADAWRAEADFLAEPYKGSDAYETHDGLMAAMVSHFQRQ